MSNDFRNGYSAGYKGYPLVGKHTKDYVKGHKVGYLKGKGRKKRLR